MENNKSSLSFKKKVHLSRDSLAFVFLSFTLSFPCLVLGAGVGAGPVPLHTSLEQYGMNLPNVTHLHLLLYK